MASGRMIFCYRNSLRSCWSCCWSCHRLLRRLLLVKRCPGRLLRMLLLDRRCTGQLPLKCEGRRRVGPGLVLVGDAVLVGAGLVDRVQVSLVQEDQEDDVIAKARDLMMERHRDEQCERVIDEGVKGFVGHHSPRHVCHALELIVDEELRRHRDEPKEVH